MDAAPRASWISLSSHSAGFESGVASLLGIAETALATGLTLFIGIQFGSWKHLAVGCLLAPLMLLRTDQSVALGLKMFLPVAKRFQQSLTRDPETQATKQSGPAGFFAVLVQMVGGILLHCFYYGFVLVYGVAIRALATLIIAVRHPVSTLSAIPKNWYRVSACTDSLTPIELVPGTSWFPHAPIVTDLFPGSVHEERLSLRDLRVGSFLLVFSSCLLAVHAPAAMAESSNRLFYVLTTLLFSALFLLGFMIVICFLTPLAFRWSLKATAIVWSPLLYVASAAAPSSLTVSQRLERITNSASSKVARLYAWILMGLASAKVLVWLAREHVSIWLSENMWALPLDVFVEHRRIPLWQVAAVVNSMLLVGTYIFAESALAAEGRGTPYSDVLTDGGTRTMLFIRAVLTCYTVSCTLYLVMQLGLEIRFDELELVLTPW